MKNTLLFYRTKHYFMSVFNDTIGQDETWFTIVINVFPNRLCCYNIMGICFYFFSCAFNTSKNNLF